MRYVTKKRERSHHAECAMREYVSHVDLQRMTFVSIVMRQGARFVASSWQLVRVTPAGNWYVKTMESKSTSPRYVTTVGRVTNEYEASSDGDG